MHFVYLVRMTLEYHTYLLLSNNSFSVIWFVRMEGKNSFYSENHRKKFFLEISCNFKRACWFWEWGGCKNFLWFFFFFTLLWLSSTVFCLLLWSVRWLCMQWSVYDACIKVGRRQNISSPELLKHLLKRELLNCTGISCGETEYLLSTKEKEDLW